MNMTLTHAARHRRHSSFIFAAMLLLLAVALLTLVGCSPADAYVQADRATYEQVAPRLTAYTKADTSLSDPAKQDVYDLLWSWDLRIRKAEAVPTTTNTTTRPTR